MDQLDDQGRGRVALLLLIQLMMSVSVEIIIGLDVAVMMSQTTSPLLADDEVHRVGFLVKKMRTARTAR